MWRWEETQMESKIGNQDAEEMAKRKMGADSFFPTF